MPNIATPATPSREEFSRLLFHLLPDSCLPIPTKFHRTEAERRYDWTKLHDLPYGISWKYAEYALTREAFLLH